jgi:hypothetical protein
VQFAVIRKEEARLRGLGLLSGSASAEKIFRAHRVQGPYFFLEAFFLPFFFALAMLALQLTG